MEGDLGARRLPVVPGHQVVGHVVAVGDGVKGWAVGDRAGVTWLAWACGACGYCRSGRENLCREARFTGWNVDGGFASHMLVAADFAQRLPSEMTDLEAAPLLCGGVIGYRALRIAGLAPGMELGLYGFGASASLAIQVARHRRRAGSRRDPTNGGAGAGAGTRGLVGRSLRGAAATAFGRRCDLRAFRVRRHRCAEGRRAGRDGGHQRHPPRRDPGFDYSLLWEERAVRTVANVTREDAREFLALAAEIPIATEARVYRLEDANLALSDLAAGRVGAPAACVVPAPP